MPSRIAVAKELAEIFKVIAHPDRIRLIEELRNNEMDVGGLAKLLDIPQTRMSQHLAMLRAYRLVEERRDGRRHCYSLAHPELATWITSGIDVLEARPTSLNAEDIHEVRELWS
ncbi:ArsR/SmtB family transcription factor [Parasphingorhabdus sp. DH2-15]|uniref:ArsR/SmtB family transcription factor n=1 Tax=Parasphingorhabdus sp. DH2-15 TaxID=3444112 RepID=UPI003F683FE6